MTLLTTLRADQLTARKSKDTVKASLLTTLIGEAAMVGKNDGNRESTDSEVTAVIKKFVKNARETLNALGGVEGGIAMQYNAELAILETYLPKQLSEDELKTIVGNLKSELNVQDVKGKGLIMKALKERHDGQYDGKLAAQVVDTALKS